MHWSAGLFSYYGSYRFVLFCSRVFGGCGYLNDRNCIFDSDSTESNKFCVGEKWVIASILFEFAEWGWLVIAREEEFGW